MTPLAAEREAVLTRVRASRAETTELHARTRRALAGSRAAHAAVRARVLSAPARRLEAGDFRLRGSVAHLPVAAVWCGGSLDASPSLLEQAGLVVALGDVLGDGRPAALTDPRSALLTLLRACDRVSRVELGTGPRERQP